MTDDVCLHFGIINLQMQADVISSTTYRHHSAMTALFVCWYNFARKHETLRRTPAMAAGLADHVWSIEELLGEVAKCG